MEFPFLIGISALPTWKQGIGYKEMNTTSLQLKIKHLKTYKQSMQPLSSLFVFANWLVLRKPWHQPMNSHYGPKLSCQLLQSLLSIIKTFSQSKFPSCFCTPGLIFPKRLPVSNPLLSFYIGKECWEKQRKVRVSANMRRLPPQH